MAGKERSECMNINVLPPFVRLMKTSKTDTQFLLDELQEVKPQQSREFPVLDHVVGLRLVWYVSG